MQEEQLDFASMLAEADERAHAIRDLHHGRVQSFFDALSETQKETLGQYMIEHEYDTCLALSVAACDWFYFTKGGAQHRVFNACMAAQVR